MSGWAPDRARFLNLPFYQTGKVRKDPISEADVAIVLQTLEELAPELVFVAGDLSDPHGTHRMCLEAVRHALAAYPGPSPDLWLYRGAWQEWSVAEASVLVPLSEGELRRKIHGHLQAPVPEGQSSLSRVRTRGSSGSGPRHATGARRIFWRTWVSRPTTPWRPTWWKRTGSAIENPRVATSSLGG